MMTLFGRKEEGEPLCWDDLSEREKSVLLDCYTNGRVYMDNLPYMLAMDRVQAGFMAITKRRITPRDIFIILVKLRKSKRTKHHVKGLITKSEGLIKVPDWMGHQTGYIEMLYGRIKDVHPLDELAYTDEFESIYHVFVIGSGQPATRLEFWRCLMSLRKDSADDDGGRIRAEVAPMLLFTPN